MVLKVDWIVMDGGMDGMDTVLNNSHLSPFILVSLQRCVKPSLPFSLHIDEHFVFRQLEELGGAFANADRT